MKKVGILNVQHADNYGAVLLAYALQTEIEHLGYNAEIIDFRPTAAHPNFIRKSFEILRQDGFSQFLRKLQKKILYHHKTDAKALNARRKAFSDFREHYLNRSKIYRSVMDERPLDYDIYVVGSDVIWKPARVISKTESDAYFLNFTERLSCKRIAYAASIGTDDSDVLRPLQEKIKNMIRKFDSISLRENASVPFISSLYGKSVTWCIDPTMLFNADFYNKLSLESRHPNFHIADNYIYLYVLGDNKQAYLMANQLSHIWNIPVVCDAPSSQLIDNVALNVQIDGPLEFLNNIKNAKVVITDSFHGTVFSIIFRKDFYTFSRGKISIRMQDLLEKLRLTNRYVNSEKLATQQFMPVEYGNVDNIINKWKEESIKFLSAALSQAKSN